MDEQDRLRERLEYYSTRGVCVGGLNWPGGSLAALQVALNELRAAHERIAELEGVIEMYAKQES